MPCNSFTLFKPLPLGMTCQSPAKAPWTVSKAPKNTKILFHNQFSDVFIFFG
jgi:hypothetical protein